MIDNLRELLIKRGINPQLQEYIFSNVLTKYSENNYGGHGIEHILEVISRSFEIIDEFHLQVNENIVFVASAYHDIGYEQDPDNHEVVSSEIFKNDPNMLLFFSGEEIEETAKSIVDHRASLEYEARNTIGKIISSADRETNVDRMFKRSILYQTERIQEKVENPTINDIIEASYKKLSSKYGKGGYAKMYYPDKKYLAYLEEMQNLLENKELFIERELMLANELNGEITRILKKAN